MHLRYHLFWILALTAGHAAAQANSTAARQNALQKALACQSNSTKSYEILEPYILRNQHRNPIKINPIEVYGIRITQFSATIHTDEPSWGFEVPANQVPTLARNAGLKRYTWRQLGNMNGYRLSRRNSGEEFVISLMPIENTRIWRYDCGPVYGD